MQELCSSFHIENNNNMFRGRNPFQSSRKGVSETLHQLGCLCESLLTVWKDVIKNKAHTVNYS